MAEIQQLLFSHKEIVEQLVKAKDLHEGIWGICIEFSFSATNLQVSPAGDLVPGLVVPIPRIGIQRFAQPNNFTVDAATFNPPAKKKSK